MNKDVMKIICSYEDNYYLFCKVGMGCVVRIIKNFMIFKKYFM